MSNNPNSNAIPRWLERFVLWGSDRLNPLLVRNIRQNLRNRLFLSVFFLMLGIGAIACMLIASKASGHANNDAGWGLFVALSWIWGAGVIIVQSLTAFRAVITERQDDTWDLVELSTLEPRHILRGLLYTAFVQGIMFTAALAPFMVMAYMLRGLNLWVILSTFIIIPVLSLSSCTASIFLACLANKKSSRAFLGLVNLFIVLVCYFNGLALISNSREIEWFIREISRWNTEILMGLGIFANSLVLLNIMFLIFSAALLKHRAANRSTGPRAIWFFSLLNITLCFLLIPPIVGEDFSGEFFVIPGIIGAFASVGLGLFSLSEHYRITPRQLRDINTKKPIKRFLMRFLGPGAARGRIAFILMAATSLGLCSIGYSIDPGRFGMDNAFTLCWVVLVFTAITLQLSDILYRGILRRFFDNPALRREFTLTLFAVINIIPSIVVLVMSEYHMQTDTIELFIPIWCIVKLSENPSHYDITSGVLIVLGLLSLGKMVYDLIVHYRPETLRIFADEGDRNPRES